MIPVAYTYTYIWQFPAVPCSGAPEALMGTLSGILGALSKSGGSKGAAATCKNFRGSGGLGGLSRKAEGPRGRQPLAGTCKVTCAKERCANVPG
eukprot:1349925-Alexandrium_andersonii.AAC.1